MSKMPGASRREWWSLSRSDRRICMAFYRRLRTMHQCDGACCCMCGDFLYQHVGMSHNHSPVCEVRYRMPA
jgi:hypothetical protein